MSRRTWRRDVRAWFFRRKNYALADQRSAQRVNPLVKRLHDV